MGKDGPRCRIPCDTLVCGKKSLANGDARLWCTQFPCRNQLKKGIFLTENSSLLGIRGPVCGRENPNSSPQPSALETSWWVSVRARRALRLAICRRLTWDGRSGQWSGRSSKKLKRNRGDFRCERGAASEGTIIGESSRGNTIRGDRTKSLWEGNLLRGSLRGGFQRLLDVFRGYQRFLEVLRDFQRPSQRSCQRQTSLSEALLPVAPNRVAPWNSYNITRVSRNPTFAQIEKGPSLVVFYLCSCV